MHGRNLLPLLSLGAIPPPVTCQERRRIAAQKTGNATFLLLRGKGSFSDPIEQGFRDACEAQNEELLSSISSSLPVDGILDCQVRVFQGDCPDERLQNLADFVQELSPQAVAINTQCQEDSFLGFLQDFTQQGGSLVTYGKDLPADKTGRLSYIGTDDSFLGRTVARLLRQLRPEGGTFATVGYKKGRTEAFLQEIEKYNHLPGRAHWREVPERADERKNTPELHYQQLQNYSLLNPTAIVTLMQSPMKGDWAGLVKEHAHRNISFVGVDAADFQLEYLNKKLVHGLVGQLPHEIGVACFNTLHTHVAWRQASIARSEVEPILLPDRIRTNLVSYNLIPLELPPLAVDENLLGSLAWLGWILFGIVAATALYCIWWTLYYRRVDAIVRAAQPLFLIMIAVGVLILASSLIPLSFDDGGEGGQSHEDSYITTSKESSLSDSFKIGVCMSIPFQAFTGFTMIFSALFAKTWRVNRIVREALSSTNVSQVRASVATERDALFPFAILLSCNWALLLAWTLWDPLTYSRLELEGTDYWNRVLATYGGCHSDHAAAFLIPLGLLNFAGVVMSCWQAFHARNIVSEYSEARYIGLTVGSLCQAFLTGVPVVVVVREMPRAYYIVLSLTIFLLSMAVLGLIFCPKIMIQRLYLGKSPAEQSRILRQAVMRNSDSGGSGSHSGASALHVDLPTGWSSDVAYRSDHRRFNEPTVTSIPEDRVVEENSDDEFERTERFLAFSSAVENDKPKERASATFHEMKANSTTDTLGDAGSEMKTCGGHSDTTVSTSPLYDARPTEEDGVGTRED